MSARGIEDNNHYAFPHHRQVFMITLLIYLGGFNVFLLPMACHELTEFEPV
jgi:hypothetical protein